MIKVSILMLAYNHEAYIAQALDSILMQRVNFDYEVVIGEDRSADKTRDIIAQYQQRSPENAARIRPLLRPARVGAMENLLQTYRACTAPYVAVLEADDYWTDPQKLQLQADLLDARPDLSFCFHRTTEVQPDGATYIRPEFPLPQTLTIDDLLSPRGNIVNTPSVMFRNRPIDDLEPYLRRLALTDWAFHLHNACFGKIGFIDRVMAAYRMTAGGYWALKSLAWRTQETVRLLRAFDQFSSRRHHPRVSESICKLIQDLALSGERSPDWRTTRAYLRNYLLARPWDPNPPAIRRLKLLARLYSPRAVPK